MVATPMSPLQSRQHALRAMAASGNCSRLTLCGLPGKIWAERNAGQCPHLDLLGPHVRERRGQQVGRELVHERRVVGVRGGPPCHNVPQRCLHTTQACQWADGMSKKSGRECTPTIPNSRSQQGSVLVSLMMDKLRAYATGAEAGLRGNMCWEPGRGW